MGQHHYTNAGPAETTVLTSIGGVVEYPVTTTVRLRDGAERLDLAYSDLDTLNETIQLFLEARAKHVRAMLDGRTERISAIRIDVDDLIVLEDNLVMVDHVVLTDDGVIVDYMHKSFSDGTWDGTEMHQRMLERGDLVERLLPAAVK